MAKKKVKKRVLKKPGKHGKHIVRKIIRKKIRENIAKKHGKHLKNPKRLKYNQKSGKKKRKVVRILRRKHKRVGKHLKKEIKSIKRFPKPSLSQQQVNRGLRSASRRKSLIAKSDDAAELQGIKPNLAIKKVKRDERIPTGVPNFDKLIEKGFEKNTTNLLVGGSGSGKTIFATQFLIEGIRRGEKCLYVTFEEKKEQFYSNMKEFGWDLEEYEKKGAFTFLEYTPMKVKTMLEEGGGAIESVILKNKIARIVIDSITSFELLFDDELEKREAALSLFGMIRDWDATALLTLEEEPSAQEKISSRTLEFESDSIIILYFIRESKKAERDRYLEIIKMRGTKHSHKIYPFDITKKGIFVKKSAVSHFSIE